MHFEFKHKQKDQAAAVAHIKQALAQAVPNLPKEVSQFETKWQDSTLAFEVTVQGQHITGTLGITETDYIVDAKLPLMMRLFEGKLEKMIKEEMAKQEA